MEELKPGDVVRVKSGGPEMTIEFINEKVEGGAVAWCIWEQTPGCIAEQNIRCLALERVNATQ